MRDQEINPSTKKRSRKQEGSRIYSAHYCNSLTTKTAPLTTTTNTLKMIRFVSTIGYSCCFLNISKFIPLRKLFADRSVVILELFQLIFLRFFAMAQWIVRVLFQQYSLSMKKMAQTKSRKTLLVMTLIQQQQQQQQKEEKQQQQWQQQQKQRQQKQRQQKQQKSKEYDVTTRTRSFHNKEKQNDNGFMCQQGDSLLLSQWEEEFSGHFNFFLGRELSERSNGENNRTRTITTKKVSSNEGRNKSKTRKMIILGHHQ